jgi:hypothetical protein
VFANAFDYSTNNIMPKRSCASLAAAMKLKRAKNDVGGGIDTTSSSLASTQQLVQLEQELAAMRATMRMYELRLMVRSQFILAINELVMEITIKCKECYRATHDLMPFIRQMQLTLRQMRETDANAETPAKTN